MKTYQQLIKQFLMLLQNVGYDKKGIIFVSVEDYNLLNRNCKDPSEGHQFLKYPIKKGKKIEEPEFEEI